MVKKYVNVVIDGTVVPLEPVDGLPLSLRYEIQEGIGKPKGSRSKQAFKFPPTKELQEIFGNFEDATIDNEADAAFKPARIESNGFPVLYGRAQLMPVPGISGKYQRRAKSYPVAFYGNNADWFVQIKGKLLSDYEYVDHIYDIPTVGNGFYADYDSGDEFGYCLIKWKEWDTAGQVGWSEFTPFIFIRSFIDKIFSDLGYTLVSSFFNLPFFKRLIMPIPLKPYDAEFSEENINCQVERTPAQVFTQLSNAKVQYNDDSNGTNFDDGNNFNTGTNDYTIPFSGFYNITGGINISGFSGAPAVGNCLLEVRKNGVVIATTSGINLNTASVASVNFSGVFLGADVGQAVNIFLITPDGGLGGGGSYTVNITGLFTVQYISTGPQLGFQVLFPLLFGKWKVTDFLVGLTEGFGLIWETNPQAGTITAEPSDSYIAPVTGLVTGGFYIDDFAVDMNTRRDFKKESRNEPVNRSKEQILHTWKTDGDDPTVGSLDDLNQIPIFGARFNMDPDRFQTGQEDNVNKFFHKTIHLADTGIMAGETGVVPQIPLIYAEDIFDVGFTATETDYKANPRILYFASVRPTIDGEINLAGTTTGFPKAFMVNYQDQAGTDPSLAYSDEIVQGNIVQGLLKRLLLHELMRRNSGKDLDEYFFVKEMEIAQLSFRAKWQIDGGNYILGALDGYNPTNDDSTKAELRLHVIPTSEDESRVEGPVMPGLLQLP